MGADEQDDVEQGSQATTNPADDLPAAAVAGDLLNRTNTLLSELEAFSTLLETHRRPPILGHRAFIQDINAEKRFITRLLDKATAETNGSHEANAAADGDDDPLAALAADRKIKHQLSSTNVTSYEAQWAAVKRCRGLTALRQTFSRQPPSARRARKDVPRGASPSTKIKAHVRKTQDNVLVDAVVDNGATWLKVSAISERQLLFQMARQGWQNASDSSSDSDDEYGKPIGRSPDGDDGPDPDPDSDSDDEVVIVRLAKHLAQAARANRHAYRHPRIHLALPKITSGHIKEIDALLSQIRALSTPAAPLVLETAGGAAPVVATPDLTPLLTDPHASFTPTLNVDCTLLVALASDISHGRCAVQPWYPTAVQAQIRDERRGALLPLHLYPALGGRALACTREAARRMREIVTTIGTESEVVRAGLLLGGDDDDDADDDDEKRRQDLLDAFQRWSIYPVPRELRLPIRVVEGEGGEGYEVVDGDHTAAAGDGRPRLPRVAAAVAARLTDINRSIFMHGWATGCTTLSSNGTVAKQIETLVEQHRTCDEEVGPSVWMCPVARSLVAKKGRQK